MPFHLHLGRPVSELMPHRALRGTRAVFTKYERFEIELKYSKVVYP